MARRLTREEGLFVGGSSGLIAHVALQVAREVNDPNAFVVTFLCDTGERYLSKLYNDEWMRENQLLDSDRVPIGQLLEGKADGTPRVVSVAPGASVRQALGLMSLHDVSQLPVMDGESCVGSVSESVALGQGARERQAARRTGERGDGAAIPRDRRLATRRERRQAAVEVESRGARARQWHARRHCHAQRCARVSHGAIAAQRMASCAAVRVVSGIARRCRCAGNMRRDSMQAYEAPNSCLTKSARASDAPSMAGI